MSPGATSVSEKQEAPETIPRTAEESSAGAKTGTAEYGSRQNRRKHTWMIAFAPFDKPTIALAIVIEDGDSGGRTVAPLIRAALAYWFHLPDEPPPEEPETPEEPENTETAEPPLAGNDDF